jgi:SAM-dependent methyltransferase
MMNDLQLQNWFYSLHNELETAYLQHTEPWKQSGFSGPEDRWMACRKPIADCIDENGSFLDIGCANGYLLECVMNWLKERNLSVIPYGLDISGKLVELAKERLPLFKNNIFAGNAWDWENPLKFDYVRTELVYVPDYLQQQYVEKILNSYLKEHGKLLVTEYFLTQGPYSIPKIGQTLNEWGYKISKQVSGFYQSKEMIRVMVISK